MPIHLVSINTDPAEVIAGLYGIGPELAERVVQYRQHVGYFRGPFDLARVPGISQHLAVTLSPHINWSAPVFQVQINRRRWPLAALLACVGLATLVWLMPFSLRDDIIWGPLRITVTAIWQHRSHNVDSYLNEIVAGRYFSAFFDLWMISMAGFFLMLSIEVLIIRPERVRYIWRIRKIFAWASIGAWVLMVLCMLVLPDLLFLKVSPIVWGLPFTIAIAIVLILAWRPQLAWSKPVIHSINMALLVSALVAIIVLFRQGNITSLLHLEFSALSSLTVMAFTFLFLGLHGLLVGTRLIDDIRSVAVPKWFAREVADLAVWRTWINVWLPDTRDQEVLGRALNQIYRPSPIRSLNRLIFQGIGWWLLGNVLSALIQGFVQKRYLEPFLDWWRQG
jgi:hypothetical protein